VCGNGRISAARWREFNAERSRIAEERKTRETKKSEGGTTRRYLDSFHRRHLRERLCTTMGTFPFRRENATGILD